MVLQKGFYLFSFFIIFSFQILALAAQDQGLVFATKEITVGGKKLSVAIADSNQKRLYGLMNRSSWGSWQGMLFIFDEEAPRVFWMKNTKLPLSIGFFNKNKVLLNIEDMNPPKSVFQKEVDRAFSKNNAQYALEVPKGWFRKNNIKVGSQLVILN
jgi:uncharacterized membrane protein (UPF0127 family)